MNPVGALGGLAFGAGVLFAGSWWLDRRPLPLVQRIGPFVGVPKVSVPRRADWTPTSLARRLRGLRAGHRMAGDGLRRVRWAAAGAAAGLAIAITAGSGSSAWALVVLAAAGGSAGWWALAHVDGQRQRRRRDAMLAQLPMVADLVSLAVSAGASPIAALEIAANAHPGPLSDEVGRAASESRAGLAPDVALGSMIDRVRLPEVRRFVEALLLATELGTPVGEVARAQALDVRSAARRRWTEQAARREVAMLVPIVFLVLPSVVVVAMYPGVQSLRLVVP